VASDLPAIRDQISVAERSQRAGRVQARKEVNLLQQLCDRAAAPVNDAIRKKEEAYRIRAEIPGVIDQYTSRIQNCKSQASILYDPQAKAKLERAGEKAENALSDCREEQIYQANPWDQALLDSSAQALTRERAGSIGIDSGKPEEELNRDREMRLQSGKG
jgi:hypothetical protein